MGKLTISMAIFNSKLLNYQRVPNLLKALGPLGPKVLCHRCHRL